MPFIERTLIVGDYTIEIHSDHDAESPDTWENDDSFLAYACSRVGAGRDGYARGGADHVKDYHVFTLGVNDGPYTILRLGAELAPREDGTDTGPGYVYVSREVWPGVDDAREAAAYLVDTWNDYLSGNVYGYVVKDAEGDRVESCWGFIGDPDTSGVVGDAHAVVRAEVAHRAKADTEARDAGHDPATPSDGADTEGPAARE